MQGTVLDGRYTLVERIGAGGMGEVWRAEDSRLRRRVAVKVLSMPRGTAPAEGERLLAMFVREARAAAALDSSYIVPVFDHGSANGVPYLVMPLLTGRTVGDLALESGPLAPERVAAICAQVCRALATAHRAGIVHRDIKPANVMVTDEGTVKVLDFGVAKFLDATATAGYLTGTADAPVGTLHYMAPERFTRGVDDGRGDVYSLGCMVYQLLAGAPPFDADSAAALMHGHVYETPDRLSARRAGLAPEWDDLLGRMLAKRPADRPDAQEAGDALDRLGAPAPGAPPPPPASATPTSYSLAPPLPPMPQAPPSAPTPTPTGAYAQSQVLAPQAFVSPSGPSGPSSPFAPSGPPGPSGVFGPAAPAAPVGRSRARVWGLSAVAAVAAGALVTTLTVFNPFGDGSDGGRDDSQRQGGTGSGDGGAIRGDKVLRAATQSLTVGTAADSKGPAPAVRGAREGGQVTVLEPSEFDSLDPALTWPGSGGQQLARLVHRGLTAFKTGAGGSVKVVGDLAEDAGRTTNGRDWTFRLKSGLTYNDGTPVRSKDFRHAIERTFESGLGEGDQTLRTALYGPKGARAKSAKKSAIETPDDRTVVFHLAGVHRDFNVVLAGPSGAPVPQGVDGEPDRSKPLPSTGPYQISGPADPKDLTLTRNPKWRKDTDPVRSAYPDSYRIRTGVVPEEIRARIGSAPAGKAFMTFSGADDPSGRRAPVGSAKAVTSPTWNTQSYVINTDRVKNLDVRRAIATALPADDILKASGGEGRLITHLLPPGVPGTPGFDPNRRMVNGDTAKARKLLLEADEMGYRLTLAHPDTGIDKNRAEAVEAGLEGAGFEVTVKQVPASSFWSDAAGGKYDLFRMAVGGGLPTGSNYLPDYFDGRHDRAASSNYSRLDNAKVNAAIDAANGAADLKAAGKLWAEVNRLVLEQAAAVPVYVPERTYLYSPALRGLQVDLSGLSPVNAYVNG
ncbi:ABC transporter substrate-binding protein [Streptomyces sp. NRRL S-920]|uniref:ABC transporter substrate-binding protein n=1 Tax=Streptomyces sp. NRRL S-920 TaxID=1463921 RepID=UPI0004C64578|nr:ABC transporter substrate-binding protein [Streptomyces sp. NRRL S-920]